MSRLSKFQREPLSLTLWRVYCIAWAFGRGLVMRTVLPVALLFYGLITMLWVAGKVLVGAPRAFSRGFRRGFARQEAQNYIESRAAKTNLTRN